jgi:hypothetical protein
MGSEWVSGRFPVSVMYIHNITLYILPLLHSRFWAYSSGHDMPCMHAERLSWRVGVAHRHTHAYTPHHTHSYAGVNLTSNYLFITFASSAAGWQGR